MQFIENEVKEVGPGVWVRVAVDNISWCDMGDGAVVIDALEDPEQADVVRGLIKETTGKDIKWVINTHWDKDHIACNPQWRREGAIVIAHQFCAAAAGAWEGRPDISFSDHAVLRGLDDQRIQMHWMGGTHTAWDTILYISHARVLHIADLFGWGLIPCQPTPRKVARLKEVLSELLVFDADVVICGHGPTATLAHIRRFLEYFDDLAEAVAPLAAAGKSVEAIEAEVPAPEDMHDWWRFTDWKHQKNIEMLATVMSEKE